MLAETDGGLIATRIPRRFRGPMLPVRPPPPLEANENARFSPSTLVRVIRFPVFFARNETAVNGGGWAPVAAVV